ncbi:MAG: glycosyltransferase family 4 protein [Pyrinomonadaceae bacterium]
MKKSLYICYFGLREPLVQTQVLPYLREIVKDGVEMSLLTFEPVGLTGEQEKAMRAEMSAMGIKWHWLRYHKWPSVPATAFDILNGTRKVWSLMRKEKFDVLHGRVHIPTLMGALARKFSKQRPKLLFDIRGFFPEEYTDAGRWPENGWIFRAAKRIEGWLMKEADGFVVLTERAREILFPESRETGFDKVGRPVEVIPCCVDMRRFRATNAESRAAIRRELGIGERKVIAYVGSFGGWYMTDEMMNIFAAAREQDSDVFVMILTQREKEKAAERLKAKGFTEKDFHVVSVSPDEIPRYLCAADISLSFIKACYSKLSSSPTKIAEYLACGVPIIANRGVGDVDALIEENGVGVLVEEFSTDEYGSALERVAALGDVVERCRITAAREFDLEKVGGERYRRVYRKLLN